MLSPPFLSMANGEQSVINYDRLVRFHDVISFIGRVAALPKYAVPRVDVVIGDLNALKVVSGLEAERDTLDFDDGELVQAGNFVPLGSSTSQVLPGTLLSPCLASVLPFRSSSTLFWLLAPFSVLPDLTFPFF